MMWSPILPENAPFTPEQRAWLNGFFAGLLSYDGAGDAPAAIQGAPAGESAIGADPPADGDDGEAPWHDQTMAMAERMTLAEGRPLRRRMMAAMAQQDCGQCGYTCEDYSNALYLRAESRLNLCVPGGKETSRALKALYAEMVDPSASASALGGAAKVAAPAAQPGRSREAPVMATFLGARLLNKGGSEKETRHVEFDLDGLGLDYKPGDSFGVVPSNDPELVAALVARLGVDPASEAGDGNGHSRRLDIALSQDVALAPAPDALFELLATLATDADEQAKLLAMAQGEDPDGDLEVLDVLAALEKFPVLTPTPRALLAALDPLQPRLYSISSSPTATPGKLHLTVDIVRWRSGERERKGVASTFLAERIAPGERLPVYVQASHGFALPADPAAPIIMVGPGTGVAPFRSFLHERRAVGATGRSWLFFGHQRRACDFFYEDEFTELAAAGTLTRLTTAFSRDQAQKVYVQDRMIENGGELFRWLQDGAYFYVCGDAKRMAADVERALHQVLATHGAMDADGAKAYVADLIKSNRYLKDVY
ncbi:MAG: sulfite reductase subunit alpha [Rhodospirillales bacterium]|nr:sulfite reductase subunit alpha [Rhodospirillales bacterium]